MSESRSDRPRNVLTCHTPGEGLNTRHPDLAQGLPASDARQYRRVGAATVAMLAARRHASTVQNQASRNLPAMPVPAQASAGVENAAVPILSAGTQAAPTTHDSFGVQRRNAIFRCLLSGWAAALLTGCGGGGGSTAATPTTEVRAEAVVLSGVQTSRLRQPATAVRVVYGYSEAGTRIDYLQGTDWQPSGQGLARTAGSRLPDFAGYRYMLI